MIGSLVGGIMGMVGGNSAANAAERAAGMQMSAAGQAREDLTPWFSAGHHALDEVTRLLGLGNLATNADGITYVNQDGREYGQAEALNRFQKDPDYQFRLAEGEKGMNRSLAAKTGVLSGAAVKEGMRFNQGMAADAFGNYFNRMMGLAGGGQQAATSIGQMGVAAAKGAGDDIVEGGKARQSGYQALGKGISSGINNVAGFGARAGWW